MSLQKPKLIEGGIFNDDRGSLRFINDFDLVPIRRMYFTTNVNTSIIRAWQGHKIESRWFVCCQGAFTVKLVEVLDWENQIPANDILEFEISADKPSVLHIPPGYANGFKANIENSQMMIFSDYELHTVEDNYKFEPKNFKKWEN